MKFEFTEQEMQYIVNCIAEKPLKDVEGLVNNIRKQYTDLTSVPPTVEPISE